MCSWYFYICTLKTPAGLNAKGSWINLRSRFFTWTPVEHTAEHTISKISSFYLTSPGPPGTISKDQVWYLSKPHE